MKIINLPRGQGKTIRLLYASEFNDVPILCATHISKQYLLEMARKLRLNIPEPIVVSDFFANKIRGKRIDEILVDDAEIVLQQILYSMGLNSEIKAMTITKEGEANGYHY